MADGFFGGLDKGMKLGIPLALKSMDLDMAKAKLDLATQERQDTLLEKAEKLEFEKEKEQTKIKTDQLTTLMAARKEAGFHGDENLFNQINEQIRQIDPIIGDELASLPTETYQEQLVREAGELGVKEEVKGKIKAKYKEPTLSKVGKLTRERDALPEGDPRRADYDLAIQKTITPTGMSLEVDADGNIRLIQGAGAGIADKVTKRKIEEKLINTNEAIARLKDIESVYSPALLEVGTKFNAWVTKWKDKLQGTPVGKWVKLGISEKDLAEATQVWNFQRTAIDNINRYIKEITGAQMSEREVGRLRLGMPDPGQGVFDGDSPTQFGVKWKSTMRTMRTSQARYISMLKQGIAPQTLNEMAKKDKLPSLKSIELKIQQRGDELIKQGLKTEQVKSILENEFFKFLKE